MVDFADLQELVLARLDHVFHVRKVIAQYALEVFVAQTRLGGEQVRHLDVLVRLLRDDLARLRVRVCHFDFSVVCGHRDIPYTFPSS